MVNGASDPGGSAWRAMVPADLDAVEALGDRVHPGLPESRAVFAERLALFPEGCIVLPGARGILGYGVSHPIRPGAPPPLDTLLGALPLEAAQYYIHDVVVAPEARGRGAAGAGVERLLGQAARYPTTALVSVYGTARFWRRFGFRESMSGMAEKLAPYGPDAVFMVRDNAAPAP